MSHTDSNTPLFCDRPSGVLSCSCGAQWTLPALSLGGIEQLSKTFLDAHQGCASVLRSKEILMIHRVNNIDVTDEGPCPRCHSPQPHLHPAVQEGGEVQPCSAAFHRIVTPQNTPERIAEFQTLLERISA